jgi:hypothetical protein
MRWHAFVRAQYNTTAIDENDFSDRLFRPDRAGARIVKVQQFTGQR